MECSRCHHEKLQVAFAIFRTRSGEIRRRGICQACRGLYATENFEHLQEWRRTYNKKNRTAKRERDALRRAETKAYVDNLKTSTPCADCKRWFAAVCMDFDHVRGAKIKNIATMVASAYKLNLIKIEIAKCEIVCACCHRLRTQARNENLAPTASQRNAKEPEQAYTPLVHELSPCTSDADLPQCRS